METRFDIIRALDAKGTIEAYLNGKPVEYLNNDSMEWVKVDQDHEWNFEKYQYRINTELMRPYKNMTECIRDMVAHGFDGLLKFKNDGQAYYVDEIKECLFDSWFRMFTYPDATPFGHVEETNDNLNIY